MIHTGEGTDEKAEDEIDELLKWNFLKRKLVGIHAVAMNTYQAKKFKAIVWCPESNKFLFNSASKSWLTDSHAKKSPSKT